MTEPVENYWPASYPTDDVPEPEPVILLKQQAQLLKTTTNGCVEGVVKRAVEGSTVYHSLYARVPALGDYMYKFLYIGHPVAANPANPFPIDVEDSLRLDRKSLQTMDEFRDWLKDILASEWVRTTIGRLMSYSSERVAS
jgi:hypothetical protein